ncbi:MAG: recombination-associated protein RdgC [Proteobacteria bacterium]|nr:recombination-associated protein RdgC [Pseudomonadota bacterium]
MLWFRNIQSYRLAADHNLTQEKIATALASKPFVPCSTHDLFSQGWIPPAAHMPDLYAPSYQNAVLVCLKTEEKLLPAAVVNQQADNRIQKIEADENRRVGRREIREIREHIAEELIPRAFAKSRSQRALIDLENGWIWVEGGSASKTENLLSVLREALGSLPTQLIDTQTSPQTAMTLWLQEGAAEPFTLDADCELRFPGDDGAVARFTRQHLESDEVRQNLVNGKLVSRLGLVWEDRLAFLLSDKLEIKRLAMLDVVQEELEDADASDQAALFDSSLALLVGELRRFFPALLAALGGESKQGN